MRSRPILSTTGVVIAAAIIALAYTLCTDQTWEDYWITFRSAKNLAMGNGLVHNVGQRLHSFTSPIGVLLPALSSLVTGNSSDTAALWVFRIMSIAAFAGAAGLMFMTARGMRLHHVAAFFLVAWLLTDNKSQSFAANGMETSFLLLFIAYSAWALFTDCGRRRWLHLGLAWAGLMWTRPDSFIYISAMGLAVMLFNDPVRSGLQRTDWLHILIKAGLVCTVVYLPWFIGSWVYYGTPIPHTITAKAVLAGPKTWQGALRTFIELPVTGMLSEGPVEIAFAPPNVKFGGWPMAMRIACRGIAVLCYVIWLIPGVRWQSRAASFVYAIFIAYLSYFPAYPASWYLPGAAWLALLALSGLLEKALDAGSGMRAWSKPLHRGAISLAAAVVLLGTWMSLYSGQVFATQQKLVDGGNRRDIGLWLKEHAQPGDTVFLECLGYIGYYSELRTYDFPGMSSPEVVQASRRFDHNWQHIVGSLKPDWLVLRPQEVLHVMPGGTVSADTRYELVKTFDITDRLKKLDLYGEGLLSFDSCFLVFHRVYP